MPLERFCHLVRYWAVRNAEKEADVAKFDSRLWMPPVGEEPKGPWSPEAENASLASLKSGLGQ